MPSISSSPAGRPFDEGDDLTPRDLAIALTHRPITLIDVREPVEWSYGHLPGARLIPLDTVPQAIPALSTDEEIVVYCHHGMRSGMAAEWLREQGFRRVRNLTGGIDRYSVEVDPSIRRY